MDLQQLNMYAYCLLASITFVDLIVGQQAAADTFDAQAPAAAPTECYSYQTSFGGKFLREFYTCCIKGNSATTAAPCQQEPEPVPNFQCKDIPKWKNENVTKHFNCNGRGGQMNAMKRCVSRWAWLEQDPKEPECWAWSRCFEGACENEVETTGSSLSGKFCGDGQCDASLEDHDSCPIDCCPQRNAAKCQVVNNTCPDPCCGELYCCNIPTDNSALTEIGSILIWSIVGVVGFIVLLNIVCCCCCVCCAKCCCKKSKNDGKHSKKDKQIAMSKV